MKRVLGAVVLLLVLGGMLRADSLDPFFLSINDGGAGDSVTYGLFGTAAIPLGTTGTVTGGAFSSANGALTWAGSLGSGPLWTINITTGLGSPAVLPGSLDLNSINGTGIGVAILAPNFYPIPLNILWSQTGILAPTPSAWEMSFGGTLDSGALGNVTYSAWEDNSNKAFGLGGTPVAIGSLGPFGPGAFSGTTSGPVAGVTGSYSLTQKITILGQGSTTYSGDASLDPVPEPSSLLLMGIGLIGLAGLGGRKLFVN